MYTEDRMGKSTDHTAVILEDINGKFDQLIEVVAAMQTNLNKIPKIETELTEVREDVKVIKSVVTDHSSRIKDHELRLTKLEAA